MKIDARAFAALFSLFALVTDCSGSGGPGNLPQSQLGSAAFSILVPAPGSGTSATMQSVEVILTKVNGLAPSSAVAPMTMNLSRKTSGCAPSAGGALTCVAKIAVPPGKNTFSVITFAQPNHLGAQVYASVVTTTISPGRSTSCVRASPSPGTAAPVTY